MVALRGKLEEISRSQAAAEFCGIHFWMLALQCYQIKSVIKTQFIKSNKMYLWNVMPQPWPCKSVTNLTFILSNDLDLYQSPNFDLDISVHQSCLVHFKIYDQSQSCRETERNYGIWLTSNPCGIKSHIHVQPNSKTCL